MSGARVGYDPQSDTVIEDPYPTYARLREVAPFYRHPDSSFCALSRYDDVKAALLAPDKFSSRRSLQPRADDPENILPMMVILDPPRHDELRAMINRAFTPRRVAELEVRVRELSASLVDAFVDAGSCDLWAELAAPLPTTIIAELLGIPAADREFFKEKSTLIASSVAPAMAPEGSQAGAARELAAYLAARLTEKRKRPTDDLMSALLAAECNGQKLTDAELIGFALLLLIAGNETTTNLIVNSAMQLVEHPDLQQQLAEEPARLRFAIEEFLRIDPPIQALERIATDDQVLRGEVVTKGEKVLLLLGSANRDERRFAEPDRLDINRQPNAHLSFGLGVHFCLGASLARLEARVAWEEFLKKIHSFGFAGPVARLPSGTFRGVLSLPIEFSTL